MHKQAGDEIEIYDVNHVNDPEWYDNLLDIKLSHFGKQDVNLVKNFRKEDFLRKKKPQDEMNLQIDENEEETIEAVEAEAKAEAIAEEAIKKKGDIIAKANIVRKENEFVQQQVDTVLEGIASIKQRESEKAEAFKKKQAAEKKKEAEERRKKKSGEADEDDTSFTELEVNDTYDFFVYS